MRSSHCDDGGAHLSAGIVERMSLPRLATRPAHCARPKAAAYYPHAVPDPLTIFFQPIQPGSAST